ncbi:MAG: hypothetical protein Q7S37_04685 [bacterium]|nr:hypothetical protein [bacterium]
MRHAGRQTRRSTLPFKQQVAVMLRTRFYIGMLVAGETTGTWDDPLFQAPDLIPPISLDDEEINMVALMQTDDFLLAAMDYLQNGLPEELIENGLDALEAWLGLGILRLQVGLAITAEEISEIPASMWELNRDKLWIKFRDDYYFWSELYFPKST